MILTCDCSESHKSLIIGSVVVSLSIFGSEFELRSHQLICLFVPQVYQSSKVLTVFEWCLLKASTGPTLLPNDNSLGKVSDQRDQVWPLVAAPSTCPACSVCACARCPDYPGSGCCCGRFSPYAQRSRLASASSVIIVLIFV